MSKGTDIILSSTSSIDGVKVEEYLDFISAQVVAGTGFLSDFTASFTDFFGGYSGTYQKQLAMLNEQTINLLKDKARKLGADAVLCLRVDYDEISGKGMMMFMATASGTAVKLENFDEKKSKMNSEKLSKEDLKALLFKQDLLNSIKQSSYVMNTETWRFIIDNKIEEVIPYIFEVIGNSQQNVVIGQKYHIVNLEEIKGYGKILFSSISEADAIEWLYKGIEQKGKVADFALEIIKENGLFSFEKVVEKLNSENPDIRRFSLKLVEADKNFYEKLDIEALSKLVSLIEKKFPPSPIFVQDKGMLSKRKEVWKCECGRINSRATEICDCGKDIFGFKVDEFNNIMAINIINQKITALKSVFN